MFSIFENCLNNFGEAFRRSGGGYGKMEIVTYENVVQFWEREYEKHKDECGGCVVMLGRGRNPEESELVQVLLGKDMQYLRQNQTQYCGRIITTKGVDEDLRRFLGEGKCNVMHPMNASYNTTESQFTPLSHDCQREPQLGYSSFSPAMGQNEARLKY